MTPLRIALISYECPPETADGGIGTYTKHMAKSLVFRGHDVEVFAGSHIATRQQLEDGIRVNRVLERDRRNFRTSVLPVFSRRHQHQRFDVIEGPEYRADALYTMRAFPSIASVTRLHTPSKLAHEIGTGVGPNGGLISTALQTLGAIRRKSYARYAQILEEDRLERATALEASKVVSPSAALARLLERKWRLSTVSVVPYPFEPTDPLTNISPQPGKYITFIGRLERRKGIDEFACAIRILREKRAPFQYRIVGGQSSAMVRGSPGLNALAERLLGRDAQHVDVTGHIAPDKLPLIFEQARVVVTPSLWENFPYAVLEAMSAARTVIATRVGGIPEILDDGKAGILVSPGSPTALANAIQEVAPDMQRLEQMGQLARQRVADRYGPDVIGQGQEALFADAIARANLAK